MAQLGRALRSGRRGRRFESCHADSLAGARPEALIVSGIFFLSLFILVNDRHEPVIWIIPCPTKEIHYELIQFISCLLIDGFISFNTHKAAKLSHMYDSYCKTEKVLLFSKIHV